MNQSFSDYQLFSKGTVSLDDLARLNWDRFVSAINESDRLTSVFGTVRATEKHWLICPEYGFAAHEWPNAPLFSSATYNEDEFIVKYFDDYPIKSGERLCFDITGFIRPHLMFLLWFLKEKNVAAVDLIYSEPLSY